VPDKPIDPNDLAARLANLKTSFHRWQQAYLGLPNGVRSGHLLHDVEQRLEKIDHVQKLLTDSLGGLRRTTSWELRNIEKIVDGATAHWGLIRHFQMAPEKVLESEAEYLQRRAQAQLPANESHARDFAERQRAATGRPAQPTRQANPQEALINDVAALREHYRAFIEDYKKLPSNVRSTFLMQEAQDHLDSLHASQRAILDAQNRRRPLSEQEMIGKIVADAKAWLNTASTRQEPPRSVRIGEQQVTLDPPTAPPGSPSQRAAESRTSRPEELPRDVFTPQAPRRFAPSLQAYETAFDKLEKEAAIRKSRVTLSEYLRNAILLDERSTYELLKELNRQNHTSTYEAFIRGEHEHMGSLKATNQILKTLGLTDADLSEALRAAIKASGRSQLDIVTDAGTHSTILRNFLSDERSINTSTAEKLAGAIGFDWGKLLRSSAEAQAERRTVQIGGQTVHVEPQAPPGSPSQRSAEMRTLGSRGSITAPKGSGALIRRMREVIGMTPQDLATKMGLSRAAIYELESDAATHNLDVIKRVADAMGTMPESLIPKPQTLRETLQYARWKTGLNQIEFARRAGVSLVSLRDAEAGNLPDKADVFPKIAKALGHDSIESLQASMEQLPFAGEMAFYKPTVQIGGQTVHVEPQAPPGSPSQRSAEMSTDAPRLSPEIKRMFGVPLSTPDEEAIEIIAYMGERRVSYAKAVEALELEKRAGAGRAPRRQGASRERVFQERFQPMPDDLELEVEPERFGLDMSDTGFTFSSSHVRRDEPARQHAYKLHWYKVHDRIVEKALQDYATQYISMLRQAPASARYSPRAKEVLNEVSQFITMLEMANSTGTSLHSKFGHKASKRLNDLLRYLDQNVSPEQLTASVETTEALKALQDKLAASPNPDLEYEVEERLYEAQKQGRYLPPPASTHAKSFGNQHQRRAAAYENAAATFAEWMSEGLVPDEHAGSLQNLTEILHKEITRLEGKRANYVMPSVLRQKYQFLDELINRAVVAPADVVRLASTNLGEIAEMEPPIGSRTVQKTDFGVRLKEARLKAGLNQTQLSRLADLHVSQIKRYEKGVTEPTPRIKTLLSNFLFGVPIANRPRADRSVGAAQTFPETYRGREYSYPRSLFSPGPEAEQQQFLRPQRSLSDLIRAKPTPPPGVGPIRTPLSYPKAFAGAGKGILLEAPELAVAAADTAWHGVMPYIEHYTGVPIYSLGNEAGEMWVRPLVNMFGRRPSDRRWGEPAEMFKARQILNRPDVGQSLYKTVQEDKTYYKFNPWGRNVTDPYPGESYQQWIDRLSGQPGEDAFGWLDRLKRPIPAKLPPPLTQEQFIKHFKMPSAVSPYGHVESKQQQKKQLEGKRANYVMPSILEDTAGIHSMAQ